MKHDNLRWNPGTGQWFCGKCGRTSDRTSVHDAQVELEQHECQVPTVDVQRATPGSETVRLIKKPYKMTPRKKTEG